NVQSSFEHHGNLAKLRPLSRFYPATGRLHPRDTDLACPGARTPDKLFNDLRLVAGGLDDLRTRNDSWHMFLIVARSFESSANSSADLGGRALAKIKGYASRRPSVGGTESSRSIRSALERFGTIAARAETESDLMRLLTGR